MTSLWLSVEVVRSFSSTVSREIVECQSEDLLGEVVEKVLSKISEKNEPEEVSVFNSNLKTPEHRAVPLNAPISICSMFQCNSIRIKLRKEVHILPKAKNAFSCLMESSIAKVYPEKHKTLSNQKDVMYNDLVRLCHDQNYKWIKEECEIFAVPLLKCLNNILWHITSHHAYFIDRSAVVPTLFSTFANYNKYQQKKIAKPRLNNEVLKEAISMLSNHLMKVWMSRKCFATLKNSVDQLVVSLDKMSRNMTTNNGQVKAIQKSKEIIRNPAEHAKIETIPSGKVTMPYQKLDEELRKAGYYSPVSIMEFEPDNRFKRREWLSSLRLSNSISMITYSFGGNVGNINFVWNVPEERDESKAAMAIIKTKDILPIFHTRAMREDFIEKYQNTAKMSPSILNYIYKDLTDDASSSGSIVKNGREERIARFISNCDEPEIIADLRKLNGKPNSTKFDDCWSEIGKMFEEYQAAVHERRNSQHLYLPFAISVGDLLDQVRKRKPDIEMPSEEWVRLQFVPKNTYAKSALAYTGRFPIKYMVQKRQLRAEHVDSKYAYHYLVNIKQFSIKYRDNTILLFVDDKATVNVGAPDQPISTNVRAHNRSLGAENVSLSAMDHDWHMGGIVPSVVLVCDIPERCEETFNAGEPFVTNKEKIFNRSTPFRHAAEILNILRSQYSNDGVETSKEICIIYSDGGPDHNVTFGSVKISLICLFVQLNVDILIAVRTCPGQSWVNFAERIMSLLNLALQNVSLCRDEMDEIFERMIVNKSSMTDVRQVGADNEGFEEIFAESMRPVIDLLDSRFQRMKLKRNRIQSGEAASDDLVEEFFATIYQVDPLVQREDMKSTSLGKLQGLCRFILDHCDESTYAFQIKKCRKEDCLLCTVLNPPRLPSEEFAMLSFLPHPTLDLSKQHYKSFDELYGTETNEENRPGSLPATEEAAKDKQKKALFVAGKLRGTIKCVECKKPRCYFYNAVLSNEEKNAIRLTKEERVCCCGSPLLGEDNTLVDSIVVRRSQRCSNPMETTYYAAGCNLREVCFHCGGGSQAELLDDEFILDLKARFAKVSLCVLSATERVKNL